VSELQRLPTPGSTWKHRGGDEYIVIGLTSEPDAEKAEKFPRTVFYRGPDGRQWTRTLESWRGSFTFVREAADAYPTTRILEHAEYLAAGTDRFMDCACELIDATLAVEEADDKDAADKAEERLTDARESFSEALKSSRSDIHEFRKRAARYTPALERGAELDGALFRYWIEQAASRPARIATALVHCITAADYRDTLMSLMQRDSA
jgi:hypothetical protein